MITVLQSQKIVNELRDILGFQSIETARDRNYACPSPEWLGPFGEWCRLNQPAKPSEGETGDCDDSALWAVVEARKSARDNPEFRGSGYAVFYCTVRIPLVGIGQEENWDGNTNDLNGIPGPTTHTTCLVRCSDGIWYFFEPQTGLSANAREAIASGRVGDRCFVLA